MREFRKILVAITHFHTSNAELRQATTLAVNNRAELTFINIIQPGWLENPLVSEENYESFGYEQLRDFAQPAVDLGITVDTRQIFGYPCDEVIRLVEAEKFDLVVKLADPSGFFNRTQLSGNDLNLIRHCPCPVWMMQNKKISETTKNLTILCALDISIDTPEQTTLNEQLLSCAAHISHQEKANLHIIYTWDIYDFGSLRSAFIHMTEDQINDIVQEEEKSNRRRLVKLIKTNELTDFSQCHLIRGRASHEIQKLAAKLNTNLVIMGTAGRTGLAAMTIGNTAENVFSGVDCSILAIKPACHLNNKT